MSLRLRLTELWLRLTEKPYLARATDVARARAHMERLARLQPLPPGMVPRALVLNTSRGAIPALGVGGEPGAGTLLWLHGGAYCLGSPSTHVAMAAALARRAGLAALLPDYRLAPEHPFPAAVEDAGAVYHALLDAGAAPLVLGGDSSGGGLAFALLHQILADGLPRPAALVAFSPWVDLTLAGASLRDLARRDALLPAARMAEVRELYLRGADPRDPRASPRFGRFKGAPPVLIQASASEILRDDARAMTERLRADGVEVRLDLWRDTPHVWQIFQGTLPEADTALDRAARFIRSHTKSS